MPRVLVTGGSGFLASHCMKQLLERGYTVCTTVRSAAKQAALRADPALAAVAVFIADLEADNGWAEAVAGCDYVLHVASPLPTRAPVNEDEVIRPACDGTLRVLRAARRARVKRVVLTSSFAAMGYGHAASDRPTVIDERAWTNLNGAPVAAYIKSKTLAEAAAWDFYRRKNMPFEFTVLNAVVILGPTLGDQFPAPLQMLDKVLRGRIPACPRVYFGVVDVRDVADAHIRALESHRADGERFLLSAGDTLSFMELAQIIKTHLGRDGAKAPNWELPNGLVKLLAPFNAQLKSIVPQLGVKNTISNAKARTVLGWQPRSNERVILDAAKSLLNHPHSL